MRRWRIPFMHHPPYCAGPRHHNSRSIIDALAPLFQRSGVRAVLSGHEHNFQHSHWNDIDYFVSGAGSKIRSGPPDRMEEAHTVSWAAACHFLLVTIDGATMTVRAIAEEENGQLEEIERYRSDGTKITGAIRVGARV